MKKIKLKNKVTEKEMTIWISEGIQDINCARWVEIKKKIIEVETGSDIPSLKEMFVKFTAQFDTGSPGGMYRVIHDYIFQLGQVEGKEDPDQLAFAYMTLTEGEDPSNADEGYMKEKLKIYFEHGLDQGTVKREVENFILKSLRQ